jgi:hypothetical protein
MNNTFIEMKNIQNYKIIVQMWNYYFFTDNDPMSFTIVVHDHCSEYKEGG